MLILLPLFKGQASIAEHRFESNVQTLLFCVPAPQECYLNSVSVLRRCCGAVRPACVGVEQQRQHIRVSTKAPALQCSAGRPTSSENSFFPSLIAAAAVLVAIGRPPAHFFGHRQQQQEQQHMCLRLWQRWRHLLEAGGAGDCSFVVSE